MNKLPPKASGLVQFAEDRTYSDDSRTRRELGRQHMSAAMIYWLSRNGWSHPNLEVLASWALNEPGVLHTSQVSHIRNGKMRMMGVKTLDAFGAINIAVWAYQQSREAFDRLHCATVTAQIQQLIEHAEVLLNPYTGEPIDQGDWMMLYLGYLQLQGVVGGPQGDADLVKASAAIGRFVASCIASSGHDFIEAKELFELAFPERERAHKLVAVAAGLDAYDPEELRCDVVDICRALSHLGDTWTPQRLLERLSR